MRNPERWREVARQAGLLTAEGGVVPTIFAEMSALAARTGAINLGQGFPDTDGPPEVLEAAVAAIRGGGNQYPPGPGIPELREAVASHQKRFWGLEVNPDSEVLITAGATEAITAAVLALCGPGDEVLMLEPYYDSYAAAVALAGATRRTVPLRFPDFTLDAAALAAATSSRTRLLLLNTPHNPTGRVLSPGELESIARVAIEHDLLVLTDEVYEHLVFDGAAHLPLAALPGMADRVITVSSAGKTFSVTGWKIGWLHARPDLVDAITTVKQYLTYVNGGPFQPAVARGLALPDSFFEQAAARLAAGRDLVVGGLQRIGCPVSSPAGGYFAIADVAPLGHPDGPAFCRALPELAGVVAVPVQAFCDDRKASRSLVRFAYCKRPELLAEAMHRLERLAG